MVKKNWDDMTEKEREDYVSQDEVPRKRQEILSKDIDKYNDEDFSPWPDLVIIDTPSRRKSVIIGLWKDGKSKSEISRQVGCSRRYVRDVIKKYEGMALNNTKNT